MTHKPKHSSLRLFLAVGAAVIVVGACIFFPREHPFRFFVFDVGQGDALFFESPTGEQMLIDGGPSNAVLEKLGRAMPPYDRSIDVVLLTHPDADHLTGLLEVLRRYRVGRVVLTEKKIENVTYKIFLSDIASRRIPIIMAHEGDTITLGATTFTVLAPRSAMNADATETNDYGIVGRLSYQSFSVMLTADVSAMVEKQIIQSQGALTSTILKVGHHGSRSSASETFLDAVQPELAVISVGEGNSFGHPHADVLGRLSDAQIPILRTDQGGDIRVESDGRGYRVSRGIGFRLW